MKKAIILLAIVFFVSCEKKHKSNREIITLNLYLVGNWSGEATFFDKDIKKALKNVVIEFEINDNYQITGRIGDAKLTNMRIIETKYGFGIKGILDSKIKKDSNIKKNHLIILLVLPKENRDSVNVSDANFHLKSNYTFDFSMHVGGLKLTKK